MDYYDSVQRGLVLRINYGGSRIWRARYYLPGKNGKIPTTEKLGEFPAMSVKQARTARKFLAHPPTGCEGAEAGETVRQVAKAFLKRHVEEKGLRTQAEIERRLDVYVLPEWESLPFKDIKRKQVAELLDKIQDNNGPRQADLVLADLRKMANWYASRTDDYSSPIVKGMKRNGSSSRERTLDDDEIRRLWNACSQMGTYGALVKTLLLTAQRVGKVGSMQWRDIEGSEWHIPKEEGEKSNAGDLKLAQLAMDIIRAQQPVHGNLYVFTGRNVGSSFNSYSQRKEELDSKLGNMPEWTLHYLRRTARSQGRR